MARFAKLVACKDYFLHSVPITAVFMQIAIEIPYVLLQSLIYVPATYAMIGFKWTASKFFWNLFYTNFALLYFAFFGMMAVALTPNQSIASLYSVLFYNVWNLFAGFVIPRPVCLIKTHTLFIECNSAT